jgi:ferredoxin
MELAPDRIILLLMKYSNCYIQYSQPQPTDRLGIDYDARGRLNIAVFEKLGVPRKADFYLCGPSVFMDYFIKAFSDWHVTPDHIHTEIFGSGKSITPGIHQVSSRPPHAPEGPPGKGPKISFARAGLTVPWDSRFQNLLELAEACDIPVRFSCRTGVCHTCECGLISGSITYDPEPLGPPATGNLFICCAKPQEELVIDI